MDIDEVVIPVPGRTARNANVWVLFPSPGDRIQKDQLIALLESDRGLVQVTSPFAGIVKGIQVKVGTRVSPGAPMLTLDRIEVRSRPQRTVPPGRLPMVSRRRAVGNHPTLVEFQRQIEAVLGRSLTPAAGLAVADFWTHWKAWSDGFAQQTLKVEVDADGWQSTQGLGRQVSYQTWQKLARPIVFTGLILLLFIWQAALVIITLGITVHLCAGYMRSRGASRLAEELVREVKHTSCVAGMAKLCAQYILGIIALVSATGRAHWPDYPSNALTGKRASIPGI